MRWGCSVPHHLPEVFQHEAQGAGSVGHGVGAHAHHETVVAAVPAGDVGGYAGPVGGLEAGAVQERVCAPRANGSIINIFTKKKKKEEGE